MCVLRNAQIRRSGVAMGGGSQRAYRPVQVICVLAAVLLTAVKSQQFDPIERAGSRPVPAISNIVALGERLHANLIASGLPNATRRGTATDPSDLGDEAAISNLRPYLARREPLVLRRSLARQHS